MKAKEYLNKRYKEQKIKRQNTSDRIDDLVAKKNIIKELKEKSANLKDKKGPLLFSLILTVLEIASLFIFEGALHEFIFIMLNHTIIFLCLPLLLLYLDRKDDYKKIATRENLELEQNELEINKELEFCRKQLKKIDNIISEIRALIIVMDTTKTSNEIALSIDKEKEITEEDIIAFDHFLNRENSDDYQIKNNNPIMIKK